MGTCGNVMYVPLTAEELAKLKECCENSKDGGGITLELDGNDLQLKDGEGEVISTVDVAKYLDDTNLARLVDGTLDAETGIATFERDDDTTFELDLSSLLETGNIYSADGTIDEKRTVSKGGNELVFEGDAYSTVTSKSDNKNGGSFKVESNEGDSQFYQNGKGWFIWSSVTNKDILGYSPDVDKLRIKSNIRLDKAVFDSNNVAGEKGQVLATKQDDDGNTVGTEWKDLSGLLADADTKLERVAENLELSVNGSVVLSVPLEEQQDADGNTLGYLIK